jgi:hypothetical protein
VYSVDGSSFTVSVSRVRTNIKVCNAADADRRWKNLGIPTKAMMI